MTEDVLSRINDATLIPIAEKVIAGTPLGHADGVAI